jgi:hypothetical protein
MVLNELQSMVCRACDKARTGAQIVDIISGSTEWTSGEIERTLGELTEKKIILFLGNKYLNLPTSTVECDPDVEALCAMRDFMASVSDEDNDEWRVNLEAYTLGEV